MRNGAAGCFLAGSGKELFDALPPALMSHPKGSVYLVIVAACAQVKTELENLPMDQVIRLAALIRCPAARRFKA